MSVLIDGTSLTLAQLYEIGQGAQLKLSDDCRAGVDASRRVVEEVLEDNRPVYGINTGFGKLSFVRIQNEEVEELQANLVRSHACGSGDPLEVEEVRAMIGLRINSLIRGYSGVRWSLLEHLVTMLEIGLIPVVPSRGSVGASGDLAPLSHIALAAMGEGKVYWRGAQVKAEKAYAEAGVAPFRFTAKEALALINGTQLMQAVGGLALFKLSKIAMVADAIGGASIEALMGTNTVLHEVIHAVRPHPHQIKVAERLRLFIGDSNLIASHKDCDRVQDPYSLRCIPQVHGAAQDGLAYAIQVVEREMNATTDNPIVSVEPQGIFSGGNFHGAPIAFALDAAALASSYLGAISERRCDKLVDGSCEGLPPFLTKRQGLHSGLMIVQYLAASLVSENKVLCHPASADTIPTSAGHEDHVSMGPIAAYKLKQLAKNLEIILACEWLAVAEALEFRRANSFGPGTELVYKVCRQFVERLEEDRSFHEDIEALRPALLTELYSALAQIL